MGARQLHGKKGLANRKDVTSMVLAFHMVKIPNSDLFVVVVEVISVVQKSEPHK